MGIPNGCNMHPLGSATRLSMGQNRTNSYRIVKMVTATWHGGIWILDGSIVCAT